MNSGRFSDPPGRAINFATSGWDYYRKVQLADLESKVNTQRLKFTEEVLELKCDEELDEQSAARIAGYTPREPIPAHQSRAVSQGYQIYEDDDGSRSQLRSHVLQMQRQMPQLHTDGSDLAMTVQGPDSGLIDSTVSTDPPSAPRALVGQRLDMDLSGGLQPQFGTDSEF